MSPSDTPSLFAPELMKRDRSDYFALHPNDMQPASFDGTDRLNLRNDFGDLDALAQSLIEHGCKIPLRGNIGTHGKFEITDGERRWRAAKLALERGHEVLLPCRPEPRQYTVEERIVDLVVCNGGKPLTFLEEARTIERLALRAWPDKQIADKIGRSTTHVWNCLTLLKAGDHLLKLVEEGRMSATLAIEFLTAEPDVAKQIAHLATAEANAEAAGSERITARHLPIKVGKARQQELREEQERLAQEAQGETAPWDEAAGQDQAEQDRLANLSDDPNHIPTDPFDGKDCTETSAQMDDFGTYTSGIETIQIGFPNPKIVGKVKLVPREGEWACGVEFKFPGSFEAQLGLHEQVTGSSPAFPSRDHAMLNALTRMHGELQLAKFEGVAAAQTWLDGEIRRTAEAIGGEINAPSASEPEPEPSPDRLKELLNALNPQECQPERYRALQWIVAYLGGTYSRAKLTEFLLGTVQ